MCLAFMRFGIRAFGIQSPHPVRAPIATKFAIEVLATQKDNKTQETTEVEIMFILQEKPGVMKKSR